MQSGLPGLGQPYGVGRGDLFYEPAQVDVRCSKCSTAGRTCAACPSCSRPSAAAVGWDVDLLHDAHHRLTPREAAQLGVALEPYQLFWLEDPVPAELQESLRLIRQHTLTPIAIGEVFNTLYDCQQLISEQLIDYIRMTVAHSGGLTHMQRIAHFAELYHVRTACHGPTDLSPINLAACCTSRRRCTTSVSRSTCAIPTLAAEVFDVGYWLEDGMLHLDERPGLGVNFNEERAADYPYCRAYLPVARRGDGCIHSW